MDPNFFGNFDEEPQIDLTPLIDCLFMLIIFFVLTMTFSQPVLEIVLPEAVHSEVNQKRNEILLSVKADGSLWLGREHRVSLEELSQELDKHPDKLLNVYMDRKVVFDVFITVLDLAKAKREGRFVISTQQAGALDHEQRP